MWDEQCTNSLGWFIWEEENYKDFLDELQQHPNTSVQQWLFQKMGNTFKWLGDFQHEEEV